MTSTAHPMQPVEFDANGVARFKSNAIIEHLFDTGALNLNDLAVLDFSDADRMQIAQLLGYSVSGFGDLSYASDDIVAAADAAVDALKPA